MEAILRIQFRITCSNYFIFFIVIFKTRNFGLLGTAELRLELCEILEPGELSFNALLLCLF